MSFRGGRTCPLSATKSRTSHECRRLHLFNAKLKVCSIVALSLSWERNINTELKLFLYAVRRGCKGTASGKIAAYFFAANSASNAAQMRVSRYGRRVPCRLHGVDMPVLLVAVFADRDHVSAALFAARKAESG